MNRIRSILCSIWRLPRSRGFGIQSPTHYRLVRYVLCESYPYYAYDTIGRDDTWQRRKVGKLIFRLVNHIQPGTVADMAGYGEYVRAASSKTAITAQVTEQADIAILQGEPQQIDRALATMHDGTTIILDDISRCKAAWQTIVKDKRTVTAFDMCLCGVATIGGQGNKTQYKLTI